MAANMTVVTTLLNGRRVGRFATRKTFTIESVVTDGNVGIVEFAKAIEINGKNLPATGVLRVDWAVEGTTLAGTIPTTKLSGSATRVDIASDALDSIKSAANDGKTIVFTLRGNYANASVKATLKYVAPPVAPTMTKCYAESNPSAENHIQCFEEINDLIGTALTNVTAISYHWMSGGEEPVPMSETGTIVSKTDTLLKFKMPEVQFGTSGTLKVTWSGGEVTLSGVTADMPE